MVRTARNTNSGPFLFWVGDCLRREVEDGRRGEERSLHCAGRLLRRSEAEKQMRRPAPVGMTNVADGGIGTKVLAACAASQCGG
jgi:hypothetical protein